MTLPQQLIQQSRVYLAKGDLGKALKYLLFLAKTFERTRAYRQLVVLYRSHEGLEVHLNAGTIDPDFAALQKSRTTQKLLKLADDMEAELRLEKFEVKIKITGGSVDKKVSDWVQSLFS